MSHAVKEWCGHVMHCHVSRLLGTEKTVPNRRCRQSKRENSKEETYFRRPGIHTRTSVLHCKGNGCKKRNGHRDRPLILGVDSRSGGYGTFRGLAYWNLNFGIKKNVRITERFNVEASLNVNNILNHNQLLDPSLSLTNAPSTFGQLSIEGTTPRAMEMGIRVNF